MQIDKRFKRQWRHHALVRSMAKVRHWSRIIDLCHMEKIDYVGLRLWPSGKIKRIVGIKFHLCGDGDELRPSVFGAKHELRRKD